MPDALKVSRRQFMGFLGGTLVMAAAPPVLALGKSQSIAPAMLHHLSLRGGDEHAFLAVRYAKNTLMSFYVPRHGYMVWHAALGEEIVMPDGIASIEINGPIASWQAIYRHNGRVYATEPSGLAFPLERDA